MLITDEQLSQLLAENKLLKADQLAAAQSRAASEQLSLYQSVIDLNLLREEQLGLLIADFLQYPFVRLSDSEIMTDVLRVIPEIVARKQKVIPFKQDTAGLHVAMSVTEPASVRVRQFLEKKTGLPLVVYLAAPGDIATALNAYTKDVGKTFDAILAEIVKEARGSATAEPPIIRLVDTIVTYAFQNKTSDIHLEPQGKYSLVRFRIDGLLHDIVKLPIDLHPRIVTRVKVQGKLRTDEHQAPQDGKVHYDTGEGELDIRVSIVPSVNGEKVVMRLLSEEVRRYSLNDLGLSNSNLAKVKSAYDKPFGMVLATGPTGCGKTTTLYAVLKSLNRREVNVSTIEDPVEYDIEGITQIQVNAKTSLTFSSGLRSIVRQDPDIILVGEIRDKDTAGISINAALTGHLVLSTLHTNDAATAIPRLIDLGVEPFLIASTINIVIAQRLVRKIHSGCRVSEEVPVSRLERMLGSELVGKVFGDAKTVLLYKGAGCSPDHQTGYEGRVAIYEVLELNDEIRQAIVERRDANIIRGLAIKNGMITMLEDGLEKVKLGITTIEEVLQATRG